MSDANTCTCNPAICKCDIGCCPCLDQPEVTPPSPQPAVPQTEQTGVDLIAAERARQMAVEGWTPGHDDEHAYGELSMAARAYVSVGSELVRIPDAVQEKWTNRPYSGWPWGSDWWKPSPDPIRNLVKAGALIAAEIDRLKRKGTR